MAGRSLQRAERRLAHPAVAAAGSQLNQIERIELSIQEQNDRPAFARLRTSDKLDCVIQGEYDACELFTG